MIDQVGERIQQRGHEGQLPCMAAHTAAWELQLEPAEVGKRATDMGLAISQCQLGLFGYGPKAEGKSKLLRPMPALDPRVVAAVEGRMLNGAVSCLACWDIAAALGVERLAVGNVADAMRLKIKPCQLGCF